MQNNEEELYEVQLLIEAGDYMMKAKYIVYGEGTEEAESNAIDAFFSSVQVKPIYIKKIPMENE